MSNCLKRKLWRAFVDGLIDNDEKEISKTRRIKYLKLEKQVRQKLKVNKGHVLTSAICTLSLFVYLQEMKADVSSNGIQFISA